VSFAHTFNDVAAPSHRHTQYFEMFGHRSIYHDGWRAVCPWPGRASPKPPRKAASSAPPSPTRCWWISIPTLGAVHLDEDYSECHNLAAEHRDKLIRDDRPLVG